MTRTSGLALASVSRYASTLLTHSSANSGLLSGGDVLARQEYGWWVVARTATRFAIICSFTHSRPGINVFMHRMAQAGDEAASGPLLSDCLAGKRVPLLIGLWKLTCYGGQHASEKSASIFCNAEKS